MYEKRFNFFIENLFCMICMIVYNHTVKYLYRGYIKSKEIAFSDTTKRL